MYTIIYILCCRSPLSISLEEGHEKAALALLKHADTTLTSLLGAEESMSQMLMLSCGSQLWKASAIILKFLKKESVLNLSLQYKKSGKTALHFCAMHNRLDLLRVILKLTDLIKNCTVNINQEDWSHSTSLWYAISNHHWDVAVLLIVYGATNYYVRGHHNDSKTSKRCFANTRVMTPAKPVDIMKEVLEHRYVDRPFIQDTSAFSRRRGWQGVVSIMELIDMNITEDSNSVINKNTRDIKPTSPLRKLLSYTMSNIPVLHRACANGDMETATYIMTTRPNARDQLDKGGRSALFHAVLNGHTGVAKYLIEQDINIRGGVPPVLALLLNQSRKKIAMNYGLMSDGQYSNAVIRHHSTGRNKTFIRDMKNVMYILSEYLGKHEDAIIIDQFRYLDSQESENSDTVTLIAKTIEGISKPSTMAICMLFALFVENLNVINKIQLDRFSSKWEHLKDVDGFFGETIPSPAELLLLFHSKGLPLADITYLISDKVNDTKQRNEMIRNIIQLMIKDGHDDALMHLLQLDDMYNDTTQDQMHLLMIITCKNGNQDMLLKLLPHIKHLGVSHSVFVAGLQMAAVYGHKKIVDALTKVGVDVNAALDVDATVEFNKLIGIKGSSILNVGWTSLHQIARYNQMTLMYILQENNINITEIGYVAAAYGSKDIIHHLIGVNTAGLLVPLHSLAIRSHRIHSTSIILTSLKNRHEEVALMLYHASPQNSFQTLSSEDENKLVEYAALEGCQKFLEFLIKDYKYKFTSQTEDMCIKMRQTLVFADLWSSRMSQQANKYDDTLDDKKVLSLLCSATHVLYQENVQMNAMDRALNQSVTFKRPLGIYAYDQMVFLIKHLFQTSNDTLLQIIVSKLYVLTLPHDGVSYILLTLIMWACSNNCFKMLQTLIDMCDSRHIPIHELVYDGLKESLMEIMVARKCTDCLDIFFGAVSQQMFTNLETSSSIWLHLAGIYNDPKTIEILLRKGGSQYLMIARDDAGLLPYDYAVAYGNVGIAKDLKPDGLVSSAHQHGHPDEKEYPDLPVFTCSTCLESVGYGWLRQRITPEVHEEDYIPEPTSWPNMYLRTTSTGNSFVKDDNTPEHIKAAKSLKLLRQKPRESKLKTLYKVAGPDNTNYYSYRTLIIFQTEAGCVSIHELYTALRSDKIEEPLKSHIIDVISQMTLIEIANEAIRLNDQDQLIETVGKMASRSVIDLLEWSVMKGKKEAVSIIIEVLWPDHILDIPESLTTMAIEYGQLDIAVALLDKFPLPHPRSHDTEYADYLPPHIRWLLGISSPGDTEWQESVYHVQDDMSDRLNQADCWLAMNARFGADTIRHFLQTVDIQLRSQTQGTNITIDYSDVLTSLMAYTKDRMYAKTILQSGVILRDVLDEMLQEGLEWPPTEYLQPKYHSVNTLRLITNTRESTLMQVDISEGVLTKTFTIPRHPNKHIKTLPIRLSDDHVDFKVTEYTRKLEILVCVFWFISIFI